MADLTPSSQNKPGTNPKPKSVLSALNDLSMETRLFLAFGLMALVLMVTQYFMPSTKAIPPKAPAPVQNQAQNATPAPPAAPPVPAAKSAGRAAAAKSATSALPAVVAEKQETRVIETPVYRVEFSNEGATIVSWKLKKYKDSDGKLVELTSPVGNAKAGWPFSYIFSSVKPGTDLNKVLFAIEQPDPLTIEFRYSNGTLLARKSFHFDAKGYRMSVASDVTESDRGLPHMLAWRAGFGDRTTHNEAGVQHAIHYETANSKLVVDDSKAAKNGPITHTGTFEFAGLEDNYFVAVALPEGGTPVDLQVWTDWFKMKSDGEDVAHVGAAFGTGLAPLRLSFFVGPKDHDVLRLTDPKLNQVIDWGWFWFIAKPLFLGLHWVNDNLTMNWGWAIIAVTIIINFLMLPLRFSSMRSMNKMAAIKPELDAIAARYKDLPLRDPRKAKQNEETMALYSKHGINPMGGCVPILLQMPFFIAFFKVLSTAIELRGAHWLWVMDLSSPETLPIRLLPVGMLVTQVLMQKMTPSPSTDPSQKTMMMLMPVVLSVMFYSASSGLVLYWLTGNVVGIVQQYFFNKTAKKPVVIAAAPARKKK